MPGLAPGPTARTGAMCDVFRVLGPWPPSGGAAPRGCLGQRPRGPIDLDLAKDFVPDRPNQLWVADLTYDATAGSFVYKAGIPGAWSRKVVGHAISRAKAKLGSLSGGARQSRSMVPNADRRLSLDASESPSLDAGLKRWLADAAKKGTALVPWATCTQRTPHALRN